MKRTQFAALPSLPKGFACRMSNGAIAFRTGLRVTTVLQNRDWLS
jgi:hypothetical protein